MVLDKFDKDNDMLIFKNTYDDPASGRSKKFNIRRTDPKAPEELYFVHIDIKDIDSLPDQEQRKVNMKKAEMEKRKTIERSNESEYISRPPLEYFRRRVQTS